MLVVLGRWQNSGDRSLWWFSDIEMICSVWKTCIHRHRKTSKSHQVLDTWMVFCFVLEMENQFIWLAKKKLSKMTTAAIINWHDNDLAIKLCIRSAIVNSHFVVVEKLRIALAQTCFILILNYFEINIIVSWYRHRDRTRVWSFIICSSFAFFLVWFISFFTSKLWKIGSYFFKWEFFF